MPRLGLKESSEEVLNRRFRMTLDFTLAVHEITQESVRQYFKGAQDISQSQWEMAERQNRLLLALLKNEEVLTRFLTYLITDEAWSAVAIDYANVFEVDETEEILEPVYSNLDEGDAEFFGRAREGEVFTDCTEMLEESFNVRCTRATITEVQIVAEGNVTKAEE
jgi:hypothetical protein